MNKMSANKADQGRKTTSKAAKVMLAVIGVGVVTGVTLVIGMDQVMKRIFVNEDWPDEEWSSDEYVGRRESRRTGR